MIKTFVKLFIISLCFVGCTTLEIEKHQVTKTHVDPDTGIKHEEVISYKGGQVQRLQLLETFTEPIADLVNRLEGPARRLWETAGGAKLIGAVSQGLTNVTGGRPTTTEELVQLAQVLRQIQGVQPQNSEEIEGLIKQIQKQVAINAGNQQILEGKVNDLGASFQKTVSTLEKLTRTVDELSKRVNGGTNTSPTIIPQNK